MKVIILNEYMQNIYLGFDEFKIIWQKVLWKIIIVVID
jgi:hypothetical protein